LARLRWCVELQATCTGGREAGGRVAQRVLNLGDEGCGGYLLRGSTRTQVETKDWKIERPEQSTKVGSSAAAQAPCGGVLQGV
jgi:hypothetical protein